MPISSAEKQRRADAERGFWMEMEERGLDRAQVLLNDDHYTRLCEIKRGVISVADREKRERRLRDLMAAHRAREIAEWKEVQDAWEAR
jgi:hypothetical protein